MSKAKIVMKVVMKFALKVGTYYVAMNDFIERIFYGYYTKEKGERSHIRRNRGGTGGIT